MLANKGAKGNAGHQRDRQAAEHNGNGRGRFLFATGLVAIVEPIEKNTPCAGRSAVAPGSAFHSPGPASQHITRRKQHHQRQQQLFTRHTPGQRRQHRSADSHAQRVDRDQQSCRRQEIELLGDGRDQPTITNSVVPIAKAPIVKANSASGIIYSVASGLR